MKKFIIVIICTIIFGTILYSALSMTDDIKMALFVTVFAIIMLGIFVFTVLWPIILAIKLSKKDIKRDKLSKEDLFKNELIYRDILYNYPPAVLNYIDEMEFNYQTAVISTLLKMELKGVIEKKDKEIVGKIGKHDEMQLDEIEKIILNNIRDGKIIIEKDILEKEIINESLKQKVIETNYDIQNLVIGKIKKLGIIYLILIIVYFLLISSQTWISLLFWGILPSYPTISIVYLINYVHKYKQNPILRTEKGKKINKKLEGLKNFIKEYSLLDSKDDEQLKIWEEYLIYSVIFNQNTIIIKEYSKYLQ